MQSYIKNIISCLSIFLVLCLLLCITSCAGSKSNQDDTSPEPQDINNYSELKIGYDNFGKSLLTVGAFTADGFYNFVTRDGVPYDTSNGQYGTANLTYIDYTSATQLLLCNIPGCAHNNSDCPSYMSGGAGPCILFSDAQENRIISLVTGIPGYEVETKEQLGKITLMDLTGSNRTQLYTLQSRESFSLEDSIFVDEDTIYLAVITLDEDTNQFIKEVRMIDLDTGTDAVLLRTTYDLSLVSCYEDNIVFYMRSEIPFVYSALNVHTGEIKELYSGQGALLTSKHYNYYANNMFDGTGELTIIDLIDHSRKTISGIPCHPEKGITVSDLYDGVLEWSYVTPEPEGKIHTYFVNTETGDFWEKTLERKPYDGYDITSPVLVCGKTGDGRFLVLLDSHDCEVSFTDYQGIPHIVSFENQPSYGLISMNDYYNSIPNYQLIIDQVYTHN